METWNIKYHMPVEFTAYFLTEQEYVDYMFIWIIFGNFGIQLTANELLLTIG